MEGRPVRLLTVPVYQPPPSGSKTLRLPLLLLHGLGCSARVWEPTLKEMAQQGICCPLVAPDLPGYGRSPGPGHALGIPALAEWTARLLDARGLDRVHLVANSMGCQVALALAARFPGRVGGLVLQGPTTGDTHVPRWRYVAGLLADAFQESLAYNLLLLYMYSQMGTRRYLATVEKMMDEDSFAVAARVRAPTLVIRGGRDAIVSGRVAHQLALVLPRGEYTPLDSEAHAIEFNTPETFSRIVLDFLTRAETRL